MLLYINTQIYKIMSYSYYIKNRTSDLDGSPLMNAIYDCCKNSNYSRNKIHTRNKNYITTNINFQDLTIPLSYNAIQQMNCGKLSRDYLYDSYMHQNASALISIDNTRKINTLLTFYFNSKNGCIEIDAFCSELGGGTIFNFLINAIKCGIEKCKKTHTYERKFMLKSLNDPETLGFYAKYDLEEPGQKNKKKKLGTNDDLVPLTRALSVDSNNNEDDDALMFNIELFEQLEKEAEKENNKINPDDDYDYVDLIDEYFNRNRNIYYTNMRLREDPKTNRLFNRRDIVKAARDHNEEENESNSLKSQYSPSDDAKKRKRGGTTKKRKRGSRKNKKTQTQKYKYKYKTK